MKTKSFLLTILTSVLFIFSSCEEEIEMSDDLYFGATKGMTYAFKVSASEGTITNIGFSYDFSVVSSGNGKIVILMNILTSGGVDPTEIVLKKSSLKEVDFEPAVVGTDQEFNGLHYTTNGQIMAIKSATEGLVVKIWHYNDTEEVFGATVSLIESHREVSFSDSKMTLNPITGYQHYNIFMIDNDKESRYQAIAISNGIIEKEGQVYVKELFRGF